MKILSPQVGLSQHLGGGRYDFEVLSALARLGLDVFVLLPKYARGRYAVPEGCTIQWVLARWGFDPRLANLAFLGPLLRAALILKPDILRVHDINCLGLACLVVGKILDIPTIAHFHHQFENTHGLQWTEKQILPFFDHVITVSEASRQQLLNLHPNMYSKCTRIYNGVSSFFCPAAFKAESLKKYYGIPVDEPIFITVGSLIPRKNTRWLIKLMNIWISSGNTGQLVIIGDGSEREDLINLSDSLGMTSYIKWFGRVDSETHLNLLQLADVFLFPSLMEGFGLAPVEALACGVPAIVSNRGALPEVVEHGQTGFVLSIDDGFSAWMSALKILTSNAQLYKNMSMNAEINAKKLFDWNQAASNMREIYQRISNIK